MRILAIETSCDETAIALIEASGGLSRPRFKILGNLVASQFKIHRPFGGVVPNLAKREHLRNLPLLWQRIMKNELRIKNKNKKSIIHNSKFLIPKIDLIAVTVGPGLEPALWTGIEFAKQIHSQLINRNPQLKLVGVNHLHGHLYSFLLPQKNIKYQISKIKNLFPAIALIVSGGHTNLLLMKNLTSYKKLGETRDDAVGECFDKVARLLGFQYPGGPEVERVAKKGNPTAINFPRPMINQKNYDFSFSGLKTAVLYYLRDAENADTPARSSSLERSRARHELYENKDLRYPSGFASSSCRLADIAASFQEAAFDVLIYKTLWAAREFHAKTIMVSGGVSANRNLRRRFAAAVKKPKKIKLLMPNFQFSTDNAVMIGAAAYVNFLKKREQKLAAQGNLGL